ncbi:unnamed protein product [Hydatigera taeniaeformis]|uniref:receptor protein serine/threonine kinase n=1 Tax=Hydatigena taeniaeformis TaxID=6205 RepID=A0A0R3WPD3_HYDTA|nr:unnamed protein product [Hydatigera taeniaeformis]
MKQISCYCTPDQVDCNLTTGKILCEPGQQYCLLTIKQLDDHSNRTQIQGCWSWPRENDFVSESNICYIASKRDGYITCFCKGDSCNVPNIPMKQGHGHRIRYFNPWFGWYFSLVRLCFWRLASVVVVLLNLISLSGDPVHSDSGNRSVGNHSSTSKIGVRASFSNNPTFFYAIALPLLLLVLLIFIFIFLLCRRFKTSAHPLGGPAVGGSSKFSTDKHKSFLCLKSFPSSLRFCFSASRSKDGEHQFCVSGNIGCRSCPLNGTPCVYCGNGFLTHIDGSPPMPQLVRPVLGGGWLAEDEIEELSRICTKVKRCSRGRFGEVWLGRMTEVSSGRPTSREVAIKVFPEAERRSWETELELYRLPLLKHPNILHYIGIDKVRGPVLTFHIDSCLHYLLVF